MLTQKIQWKSHVYLFIIIVEHNIYDEAQMIMKLINKLMKEK
jgi:hypothetical protein